VKPEPRNSVDNGTALWALVDYAVSVVDDPWREDPWLKSMTATQAFVVCVGAGPWKIGRRRKIQMEALNRIGPHDLFKPTLGFLGSYPLTWQNSMVQHLHEYLQEQRKTMTDFCASLKDPKALYAAAGCPKGTKVLSLFVRDYLGLPAFPVDRHVRRVLKEFNLPCKEDELVALCDSMDYDASKVASLLVRYGSGDNNLNPRDLLKDVSHGS